jgi:hypothetical protein
VAGGAGAIRTSLPTPRDPGKCRSANHSATAATPSTDPEYVSRGGKGIFKT